QPQQAKPQLSEREQKFQQFVKRHELKDEVAYQLKHVLENCEIALVCDDSSSMKEMIPEPGSTKQIRRWDELKKLAAALIDVVTVTNPKGLDIYFLNRPTLTGVTSTAGLQAAFLDDPNG